MRREGKISKDEDVVIIDLDAHQGNGFERAFIGDEKVHIFDMYNAGIYPQDQVAQKRINMDIPLRSGTNDNEYLALLTNSLPPFLKSIQQPKIAFYNAGTDIYKKDSLGMFKVSRKGILARDQFVFETLTELNIPFVMLLSGGYSQESYMLVSDSVFYALEKWTPALK